MSSGTCSLIISTRWVNSTHCGGCHRPLCAGFQALHFTGPGRGDVLRLAIGAVLHQTRGCARCHCRRHQARKLCCRQHQPVPEPGFDIAPGKHRPLRLHDHQNMRGDAADTARWPVPPSSTGALRARFRPGVAPGWPHADYSCPGPGKSPAHGLNRAYPVVTHTHYI